MRKFLLSLALGTALAGFPFANGTWGAAGPEYRAGAAKSDITGPAAELGMLGYGDPMQQTRGIHSRLHSRAFVIEPRRSGEARGSLPVAYVLADLCFVSQAVKLAVVDRLQRRIPGVFSSENVMLTATHTHAGPGGFSHSTIFNVTILGFSEQNFEAIVSGIVDSIVQAWNQRVPATLYLQQGELDGVTVNRSYPAHLQNGSASNGTSTEKSAVNRTMTQIRIMAENGRDIGVLNWFAIHATGMSKRNELVSSDNKGLASWLLERELAKTSPGAVAAFANSDEGDVSPDIFGADWKRRMSDPEAVRLSGEAQARKAHQLLGDLSHPVRGPLGLRHQWKRMTGLRVPAEPAAGALEGELCRAGFGYSFAAGAEDGPSGLPGFREGMRQGDIGQLVDPFLWLYRLLGFPLLGAGMDDERCHAPKPVLIATGAQEPSQIPWTPEVLPFQIFRIGELALIGVPAELTTEAGRRIRAAVLSELEAVGVARAVVAGLANSYASYVTTFEEYQAQDYEGASTLFGPHTLAAYLDLFGGLARALARGVPAEPGDTSPRYPGPFIDLQPGVVYDDRRFWEDYGSVLVKPERRYRPGQSVTVVFRTGHPKNDLRLGAGYFQVQRQENGSWLRVADEDDPALDFRWKRSLDVDCLACSSARLDWDIPLQTPPGTYRIVHHGSYKSLFGGRVTPFSGATVPFEIRSRSRPVN